MWVGFKVLYFLVSRGEWYDALVVQGSMNLVLCDREKRTFTS
ncbi:hypothetical protein BVRB_7g173460 [Beta vulgaris subsp. vulgaris]|nr:hypothetical protein BVRB_7g173460 [Beta vulgaris subsp. vulgaris]